MTGLPANQCIPYHEDAPAITGKCQAPVIGKRLVKVAANRDAPVLLNNASTGGNIMVNPATAALNTCLGVAAYDAPTGSLVKVWLKGKGTILPITATGAISAGAEVEAAANGTVSTKSAGVAIGLVVADAADAGDAQVLLY
jgi:hypothetical protein